VACESATKVYCVYNKNLHIKYKNYISVQHTYLFIDRITCGPSENWLTKPTSNCFIRRWEFLFFWSLHLTAEYSSVHRRELVALFSTAL